MRRARAKGVVCAFAASAVFMALAVSATSALARPSATPGMAAESSATTVGAVGSTLELEYSAPAACPSKSEFVLALRERTAGRPERDADASRFFVRIVRDDDGYAGALEAFSPPSIREVRGATCDEVTRALVVFVALALSPTDGDFARDAVAVPASDEPASSSSALAAHDHAAGGSTAAAAPPARTSIDRPVEAHREDERLRSRIGVDARAFVATGIAHGLAPGVAVDARFVLGSTTPRLAWLLHVGGGAAYREASVLDGAFTFFWGVGRVDAGPSFELGRFALGFGPVVHAGVLMVGARGLPSSVDSSNVWGDAGGFVRLDRNVSRSVAVSLMVELAVPMQRKSFGIQGVAEPVHEIPRLFGVVSAGLSFGR